MLAATAGFLDSTGARELTGVLVAHMSGNTAHLASHLSQGDLGAAWRYATPIIGFLGGLASSVAFAELATRRRVRRTLALVTVFELALLLAGAFARAEQHSLWGIFFWAAAMGAQNATLRHVAGHQVRTTFVTGMMVALVDEVMLGLMRREPERRAVAWLHAAVWSSFLAGAVGGATGGSSLALPIGTLVCIAGFDAWRPLGAEH